MELRYLVYRYIDPRQGNVVYVGMGLPGRPDRHWKARAPNPMFQNLLNALRRQGLAPRIEIVSRELTQHAAFMLERALIHFYGRRSEGRGTLCNISEGGPLPGAGVSLSEEQILRRNASIKAALARPEVKARHSAAVGAARRTEQARKRTSEVSLNMSAETRAAIGADASRRMNAGDGFREKVLASLQTAEARAKRKDSLKKFSNTEAGRELRRQAAQSRWAAYRSKTEQL